MKITELHIYGYGKLVNKVYAIEDLQLFYGENEAGKSTIMSFIHSILFGFPTRQQSELRYEPKESTEYGGKILCASEKHGKVSIERIKGKAAGDVTVQFEDGTSGGEEALQDLLGSVDKTTYRNIFSFNLDGLQDIHKLKKEELNRYLFSAGSTGTDLLLQMEQHWQKEREQLFKRSGRKPVINTKLGELKALEKNVGEAREKNKQYGPLQEEKQSLESAISLLEEEKEALLREKESLQVIEEQWEPLTEFVSTSTKLDAAEDVYFPPQGAERLNALRAEWRQVSSHLETLDSKQRKLSEKLEGTQLSSRFISEKQQVESLLAQQPVFMKWRDDLSGLHREIRALQSRIREAMRELDLNAAEKDISSINTGMLMGDRIEKVLREKTKGQDELENLLNQLQEEKEALYTIERKCDELEGLLMAEEEYQALQRKVKQQSYSRVSQQQKMWVENQLEEGEKEVKEKRKAFSNQILYSSIITLLLAGFSAWAILNASSMWTFSIMIIALLAINLWKTRQYVNEKLNHLANLRRKVHEFGGSTEIMGVDDTFETSEKVIREQMEIRSEWKQRILQMEEQGAKIEKLKKQSESIQSRLNAEHQSIEKVKAELYLPAEFPAEWLRDAFGKLKELVNSHEKSQRLMEEEKILQEKIEDFSTRGEEWFIRHSITFTTVEEAFTKMKSLIQDIERNKLIREQIQGDLESLRLEREQSLSQVKKIDDEIHSLLEEAGCRDEEEFRALSLQAEERKVLLASYEGMKTRVNQQTLDIFTGFEFKEDVTKRLNGLGQRINELIKEVSLCRKKQASVEHQINLLEEGTGYSRLLQELQDKKADLREYVMKWSKFTLARESLKKTIDHYQQTKMPNVIALAEKNFSVLTDGFYHTIHVSDETIEVERKDGMRFQAVELSQGTKEQLYISIRFALVRSFRDIYKLPLLIDDGAVNFDRDRTCAFAKLLRTMEKEHQIILFTCHPHIRNHFKENEVILLEKAVLV
ncbi:AAA family ATPase [Lysinibacillus sphaericus]